MDNWINGVPWQMCFYNDLEGQAESGIVRPPNLLVEHRGIGRRRPWHSPNPPTHPGPILNSEQLYANSVDTPDHPLSSVPTTQAAGPWLESSFHKHSCLTWGARAEPSTMYPRTGPLLPGSKHTSVRWCPLHPTNHAKCPECSLFQLALEELTGYHPKCAAMAKASCCFWVD